MGEKKKRRTCTKNLKIHKTAIALPVHLRHLPFNQLIQDHVNFPKQQRVQCTHTMPNRTVEEEWKWSVGRAPGRGGDIRKLGGSEY